MDAQNIVVQDLGLEIAPNTPVAELFSAAVSVAKDYRNAMWKAGDLFVACPFDQRHELAERLDLSYKTLENIAGVVGKYTLAQRVAGLSITHHQEIQTLAEPDRGKLLKQAVKGKWSVAMLRDKRREMVQGAEEAARLAATAKAEAEAIERAAHDARQDAEENGTSSVADAMADAAAKAKADAEDARVAAEAAEAAKGRARVQAPVVTEPEPEDDEEEDKGKAPAWQIDGINVNELAKTVKLATNENAVLLCAESLAKCINAVNDGKPMRNGCFSKGLTPGQQREVREIVLNLEARAKTLHEQANKPASKSNGKGAALTAEELDEGTPFPDAEPAEDKDKWNSSKAIILLCSEDPGMWEAFAAKCGFSMNAMKANLLAYVKDVAEGSYSLPVAAEPVEAEREAVAA